MAAAVRLRSDFDGAALRRLIDLAQLVWDGFALSIGKQTLSRELRALGYAKLYGHRAAMAEPA